MSSSSFNKQELNQLAETQSLEGQDWTEPISEEEFDRLSTPQVPGLNVPLPETNNRKRWTLEGISKEDRKIDQDEVVPEIPGVNVPPIPGTQIKKKSSTHNEEYGVSNDPEQRIRDQTPQVPGLNVPLPETQVAISSSFSLMVILFIAVIAVFLTPFYFIFSRDKNGRVDKDLPLNKFIEYLKGTHFSKYYFYEFWRRSFDFVGKTQRKDLWFAWLYQFLLMMFIWMSEVIHFVISKQSSPNFLIPLLIAAISFIPGLTIQIRRLRDIGKEPAWILLSLVPFASVILLFWYAKPSLSKNSNRPSRSSSSEGNEGVSQSLLTTGIKTERTDNSTSNSDDINSKMDDIEVQLNRLKRMRSQGLIAEDEYKSAKKKILGI